MEAALSAVQQVWASKWNDRAVLSMRKAGQPHSEVQVRMPPQLALGAQHASCPSMSARAVAVSPVAMMHRDILCMLPSNPSQNAKLCNYCADGGAGAAAAASAVRLRVAHPQPRLRSVTLLLTLC